MSIGKTVDHDHLLDGLPDWQETLLKRHQLDHSYLASAQYWFEPLADSLAAHQSSANRPVLIALNGSQGSGKSTLCTYLELVIADRHDKRVLTLSLDDFYYTREQRLALSQQIHPLFATRGVPGTHDMALLGRTVDALLDSDYGRLIDIPRFDKATDDRHTTLEQVTGPIDIVLLEGWCLGARPQPIEELVEPVNALEKEEDPDGVWRNCVNERLAKDFTSLYKRVDQWLMLQAPNFSCVFQWRLEQEQKLARSSGARGGRRIMDEAQLSRFIQFYQRLTESCLTTLPQQVDHLFVLDETRQVKSSGRRRDEPGS
jgi:D-glycerate 3-kinase